MARPLVCWNCGRDLEDVPLPISRHATCGDCFNALHCCRLCIHFDPAARPGQCEHDLADPPLIKENANFCEYFKPKRGVFQAAARSRQDDAKEKFASLFGEEHDGDGPGAGDDPDPARRDPDDPLAKLNDLFKD